MCNACHNMCCGSDEFGGCGCDGCDEPECWTEDDNDFADDDFSDDDYLHGAPCCARPTAFICEAVG